MNAPLYPLPTGINSRFIENTNGLNMHFLEAGFNPDNKRPCILLLHGFPELAYSWRKIMKPLAEAGFHVIAPDQRGYGLTTGWCSDYDGDLQPFQFTNLVSDIIGLLETLSIEVVHSVIGHDFGSPIASYCALIRPDIFKSVVLMSAPFAGSTSDLFGSSRQLAIGADIHTQLAALGRPRKHYQWYYSRSDANSNMQHCPQGIDDFMRAYYHHKSADWAGNTPIPLSGWTAKALAQLPTYYIMDADHGMAETVAKEMPSEDEVALCEWLTDYELKVYSDTYARTGFQGGFQWYRCVTSGLNTQSLKPFSGLTINQPSLFIAGNKDWGVYQKPGDLEQMQNQACTDFRGCHLVEDAGHWVQQEQPNEVIQHLIPFLTQI
jgi:pimeloyl-ACP methyl ester carboxylesterase